MHTKFYDFECKHLTSYTFSLLIEIAPHAYTHIQISEKETANVVGTAKVILSRHLGKQASHLYTALIRALSFSVTPVLLFVILTLILSFCGIADG